MISRKMSHHSFVNVKIDPHAFRIGIAVDFEACIRYAAVEERIKGHPKGIIKHPWQ